LAQLRYRIYWIYYVGGRGRKESIWEGVGIEVRVGVVLLDDGECGWVDCCGLRLVVSAFLPEVASPVARLEVSG
jgi:hypothetical protein